jgi:hypothetical protein
MEIKGKYTANFLNAARRARTKREQKKAGIAPVPGATDEKAPPPLGHSRGTSFRQRFQSANRGTGDSRTVYP